MKNTYSAVHWILVRAAGHADGHSTAADYKEEKKSLVFLSSSQVNIRMAGNLRGVEKDRIALRPGIRLHKGHDGPLRDPRPALHGRKHNPGKPILQEDLIAQLLAGRVKRLQGTLSSEGRECWWILDDLADVLWDYRA